MVFHLEKMGTGGIEASVPQKNKSAEQQPTERRKQKNSFPEIKRKMEGTSDDPPPKIRMESELRRTKEKDTTEDRTRKLKYSIPTNSV